MNANLIGDRVTLARKLSTPRLTQSQLVAKLQVEGLNIEQAQLSKIENKIRPVRDIELVIIARVLNVSALWLLGETDNPDRSTEG